MSVRKVTETRGGKTYDFYYGHDDATLEGELYFESEDDTDQYGNKQRWSFKYLGVGASNQYYKGDVTYIRSHWLKMSIASNGMVVASSVHEVYFDTKFSEIIFFLIGLGPALMMSLINLAVRAENGLNQNHFPIYETDPNNEAGRPVGAQITPSLFHQNAPGTNDYHSWSKGDPLPEVLIEPVIEPAP